MARIVSIFITICMTVIAVSVGVVAHLQFAMTIGEAVILSLMVLMVTFAIHVEQSRRRDNTRLIARFEELSGQVDGLGDDVTNLENRLTALESRTIEQASEHLEGLYEEVEVFGVLIKQLAEALADLEVRVAEVETGEARQSAPVQTAIAPPQPVASPEPAMRTADPAPTPPRQPARKTIDAETRAAYEQTLREVQSAILGNRVEIHLQPIVTLPQRHTRFYEALIRLRDEHEVMLYPGEFLEATEVARVTPRIDQIMLRRALGVAKRFASRDRGLGLFFNLSSLSLVDARCFAELVDQIKAQPELGPLIIAEFTQAGFRAMGPLELEALQELRELGIRISIDNVEDLRMDFSELGRHGVRFLKMSAERLLGADALTGTDIHLADLADLLARFGIELIVDRVETEAQVLELLDYGPRYGQGNLFAPPKAVRAEVLSTVALGEGPRRVTG